jgi:hypothetical protein
MTSSSDIEEVLAKLVELGMPFVLMLESNGSLTYYSNNKGDRLVVVNKEEVA